MRKKGNEYVKKRKSYYGFAKNYPGKLGSTKYIIGDSVAAHRKEIIRKIILIILAIFLFCAVFVATTVCLEISQMK